MITAVPRPAPCMSRPLAAWLCFLPALIGLARSEVASAPAPAGEPIVELPPMIVSERTDGRRWSYTGTPQLEVLARTDPVTVREFVERHAVLTNLVRLILPEMLRFQTTLPVTVVLVEAASAPALSRELLQRYGGAQPTPGGSGHPAGAPLPESARMIPNLLLDDADALVVFAIVDGRTFKPDRVAFATNHFRLLLERRAPALPRWFIEGWLGMYANSGFGNDRILLAAQTWLNASVTQRLRDNPDEPRTLLPLSDFFAGPPPPGAATEALWKAQAELLVRWATVHPERREPFWRYVEAASLRGDNEADLVALLGLGFADLRDHLSDYLPKAVQGPAVLSAAERIRPGRPVIRDATLVELARLKGEWERAALGFVRRRHPAYAPAYLALARETFEHGRILEPDPTLLACYGLLEIEAGNVAEARTLLEGAAAGRLARPRVYTELAALRMRELSQAGDYGPGRISAAQAGFILDTLKPALGQQPPQARAYALMAEAWVRSDAVLDEAERTTLKAGLTLFPRSLPLLYYAAMLAARDQGVDAAVQLIDQALAVAPPGAAADAFRILRTRLVAAATQPAGA